MTNSAFELVEKAMRSRIIGVAAIALLSAPGWANYAPDIDKISKTNLRAHLEFIASDLLMGRDTPSQGLDLAAQYIASQLAMYGAQPGGDNGTYFQTIILGRTVLKAESTACLVDGKALELGTDYIPDAAITGDVQGPAVFVKSGWTNVGKGIDPMKGLNLKGAVVVTDGMLPDGVTRRDTFTDQTWESPVAAAKRYGAAGVVMVAGLPGGQTWKRQLDRMTQGGRFSIQDPSRPAGLPSITVSPEVGETLKSMALNAVRAEFPPAAPTVSIKLTAVNETQSTQNVIGIFPGSDPVLQKEYVALGAHYDHVGIGAADNRGDTIYNGADDDGSGTVAMLEIARVIGIGQRPKRSTVFVWHCGEEKGLWGSQYFAAHPTIDFSKLIIQVNMDMIGMSKKPGDTNPANADLTDSQSIYVIGPKLISTDITKTLTAVNDATVKMNLLDNYDSTSDPNRYYQRSDHYSYIAKGVPAIFLFSGSHQNYHRPSDEVSQIDFDKLQLTTKLLYGIAYEFAMQPNHPRIDGPLKSLFGGTQ